MVIHDSKNDSGQKGKFQASFGHAWGKFQKWSKMVNMVENGQNGQTGKNGKKFQIYKVQFKSL